jgi:hypothetical protein
MLTHYQPCVHTHTHSSSSSSPDEGNQDSSPLSTTNTRVTLQLLISEKKTFIDAVQYYAERLANLKRVPMGDECGDECC